MDSDQNRGDSLGGNDREVCRKRSLELRAWLLIGVFDGVCFGYRVFSIHGQGGQEAIALAFLVWAAIGFCFGYVVWWLAGPLRWPQAVLFTGMAMFLAADTMLPNTVLLGDDWRLAVELGWGSAGIVGLNVYLRRMRQLQMSVGVRSCLWCLLLGPILLAWSLTRVAYCPLMIARFRPRIVRAAEIADLSQSLLMRLFRMSPWLWISMAVVGAGIGSVYPALKPLLLRAALIVLGATAATGGFIRVYPPPIRLLFFVIGAGIAAIGIFVSNP